MSERTPARIAVVGDLHSAWADEDVDHFNASEYALILFTGDLGATTRKDGRRIAKSISRLERDVLVMPGNNDVEQFATLAAELTYRRGLRSLLGDEGAPLADARARMCGYSRHDYIFDGHGVSVIAGRPFSFGGNRLWFEAELAAGHGVRSLGESVERICALAETAPHRDLIFLSHNGPAGFGGEPHAPWGNDFEPGGGDWGDPDLAEAVERIRRGSHRVLAVIGGHMHSPIRGGAARELQVRRDQILYLNPARVPRIASAESGVERRHHVALRLTADGVEAEERWVE
jgi:uncharacterized protein (TIGR04168 family)